MVLFALSVLLAACGKGLVPDPSGGLPPGDDEIPETGAEVSHGMIVLGDKLENPYTTENMRDALVSLYPTKSRNEVRTSHLYVRFLPAGENEFEALLSAGLDLVDYPVDYEILVDGDYYRDPSLGEDSYTWQYAVVPHDFEFPDIRYEILDECFITETDPGSRGEDGIDWEAVEREAYRLTGNEEYLMPESKKPKVNPSGRLPVTFYRSADDLPPFEDYAMQGRTYRFFEGEVLHPFGFGLSYTSFACSGLSVPEQVAAGTPVKAELFVENTGERAGETVIQLYVTAIRPPTRTPLKQLAAVERIALQAGESRKVELTVDPDSFLLTFDDGSRRIQPGTWRIEIGSDSRTTLADAEVRLC